MSGDAPAPRPNAPRRHSRKPMAVDPIDDILDDDPHEYTAEERQQLRAAIEAFVTENMPHAQDPKPADAD